MQLPPLYVPSPPSSYPSTSAPPRGRCRTGDWPELTDPPAATGGGSNDAALIIGIEDYIYLDDIAGDKANARAWAQDLLQTRELDYLILERASSARRFRRAASESADSSFLFLR